MSDLAFRIVEFVVVAMAVWRVSSIVAREDGPMDIFPRFKTRVLDLSENKRIHISVRKMLNSFYRGLNCIWCNSVWFSAIASIFISVSFLEWIVVTLSLSTVAIMVETFIKGE
jgi:hypothetical protein